MTDPKHGQYCSKNNKDIRSTRTIQGVDLRISTWKKVDALDTWGTVGGQVNMWIFGGKCITSIWLPHPHLVAVGSLFFFPF